MLGYGPHLSRPASESPPFRTLWGGRRTALISIPNLDVVVDREQPEPLSVLRPRDLATLMPIERGAKDGDKVRLIAD